MLSVSKAYHGTNNLFNKFDSSKARIVNDYYGGGIAYFTDSMEAAITYAKSMAKRSGSPIVYVVSLNFNKIFDTSKIFTGEEIVKILPANTFEFARGASLIKLGGDVQEIISNLKKGDISMTGEQVFKGLSRGMVNTSFTRKYLINHGYDGLKYTAVKQNVYLTYNEKNIRIIDRKLIPTLLN